MNKELKTEVQVESDTTKDVLILGLFNESDHYFEEQNPVLSQRIRKAIEKGELKKEFLSYFITSIDNSVYEKIVIIYLGAARDFTQERNRRAHGRACDLVKSLNIDNFTANLLHDFMREDKHDVAFDYGRSAAEGIYLSSYSFDKYKEKSDFKLKEISLKISIFSSLFRKGFEQGKILAVSTNLARDMVNEPAATATPEYLEKAARKIAGKNKKTKITVLKKSQLQKKGLNCILAVSRGSTQEPRLIIMEYNGGKGKKTAVVGKGITFDSGGYNIKPTGFIEDMKKDMSGAAAVLGLMNFLIQTNSNKNVIGVIPTCENMISGDANKPGDIIKAYNGKTIEVLNTDAEGRLILADALSYTEKNYSPETIIDVATLTGASIIALGYYSSGLISTDDELAKKLFDAGSKSNDKTWRLPLYEEYLDNMDGSISDLQNMSNKGKGREAGAIVAGVFLSKFVNTNKWAHLDIAGSSSLPEDTYYMKRGVTGSGVRILSYYFLDS